MYNINLSECFLCNSAGSYHLLITFVIFLKHTQHVVYRIQPKYIDYDNISTLLHLVLMHLHMQKFKALISIYGDFRPHFGFILCEKSNLKNLINIVHGSHAKLPCDFQTNHLFKIIYIYIFSYLCDLSIGTLSTN